MDTMTMMMATIAADASSAALSGDTLSIPQIAGYVAAVLIGGGAAWKVLPILLARLAVSLAGAKSEKDAIERLEGQLAVERLATEAARQAANDAYKERNDILRDLGKVQAELAGLTERSRQQAETIERQNQLIEKQSQRIEALTGQVQQLQEAIHGKSL
ncbi:hypothetical protein [Bordetella flabilis]|uniref:Uncharacterized protein n=1 Tax=Bordetella flabilis TaxID=463014 RepID=A0A193GHZ7_9BORD|nr:hypothetical protein [Bordetella flabilis]ANN78899.1 hypothetical protein BAU07_18825 [Bordetella flabilis]